AYVELSKYLTLYDSLVNQSTQDRIALMQGMFEEDLSQSELQLLIAQNENQANRIVSIQRIGILIGVSSFVFLVLMIWLIYLNRNIKKVNDQLKKQRQHISKQNQSLEITSDKLK